MKKIVLILVLMEWRWNGDAFHLTIEDSARLNPCSNGMALEQTKHQTKQHYLNVLILVLMEWRWNLSKLSILLIKI